MIGFLIAVWIGCAFFLLGVRAIKKAIREISDDLEDIGKILEETKEKTAKLLERLK